MKTPTAVPNPPAPPSPTKAGAAKSKGSPASKAAAAKGKKRKVPDDFVEEAPVPSAPVPSHSRSTTYRARPNDPLSFSSTSPALSHSRSFSFLDPPSRPSFTPSDIGPPVSVIGTTSSAPAASIVGSSSSAPAPSISSQLELTILRSQLDAARALLLREREHTRQELQSQAEQFAKERDTYIDFIRCLC
jgi:hypothetical protein